MKSSISRTLFHRGQQTNSAGARRVDDADADQEAAGDLQQMEWLRQQDECEHGSDEGLCVREERRPRRTCDGNARVPEELRRDEGADDSEDDAPPGERAQVEALVRELRDADRQQAER